MQALDPLPSELKRLETPPKALYYAGRRELLEVRPRVAIVGTRRPMPYTQSVTRELSSTLAKRGAVILSGGALGTDCIAHEAAFPSTIMLSPSSLEILYPASNARLIKKLQKDCLVLSEYEQSYRPHRFSFLARNRLVVALSDVVVIPEGDLHSGSMNSARLARELGKPLYTLPHRINESLGTQLLVQRGEARVVWSVQGFLQSLESEGILPRAPSTQATDPLLDFCRKNPFFEEVLARFGAVVYEYELEGKIVRRNGRVELGAW